MEAKFLTWEVLVYLKNDPFERALTAEWGPVMSSSPSSREAGKKKKDHPPLGCSDYEI